MLTIISASNPVYVDETGNRIDLMVKFAEFNEVLPFTAVPDDIYSYGRELYSRAKAGEFGEVIPFTPEA